MKGESTRTNTTKIQCTFHVDVRVDARGRLQNFKNSLSSFFADVDHHRAVAVENTDTRTKIGCVRAAQRTDSQSVSQLQRKQSWVGGTKRVDDSLAPVK
jgi:hypothetical protein